MNTKKLWALANNTIVNLKEKELLIEEIKNNHQLKQELALIMKLKEVGKEKNRSFLKSKEGKAKPSAYAKSSLSEIRHAAFGKNKQNEELTSLPIKDQILDEFLNDDDDAADTKEK